MLSPTHPWLLANDGDIFDYSNLTRQFQRLMDDTSSRSDQAVLAELGERLSAARLARDLTQAQLAHEAGIGKRTLERMEAGESASMTSLIRVLRALGLLDRLDTLLPAPEPTPMELLRRRGKQPQRASGSRAESAEPGSEEPWTWGDEG